MPDKLKTTILMQFYPIFSQPCYQGLRGFQNGSKRHHLKISYFLDISIDSKMVEGLALVDFKSYDPAFARVFSPSAAILEKETSLGTRLVLS